MSALRMQPGAAEVEQLRRGWKLGPEDFADWLADKLARPGGPGEQAAARGETYAALAERLVDEALARRAGVRST
jgi:broad specificity phosphatase PhoE